jgi:hypothetical protein
MKYIYILTVVILLQATQLNSQIKNSGFEIWDTTFTATYQEDLRNNLGVTDAISGYVNSWYNEEWFGLCRTTDAYSGNYSLVLYNWYNYAYQYAEYRDRISEKPQYLRGVYKYITSERNGKPAGGWVRTVMLDKNSDTVANTIHYFEKTPDYTPFEVEIEYLNSKQPDSLFIIFKNAEESCPNVEMVCNMLYLDEISLSLESDLKDLSDKSSFIYPNPAQDFIRIDKIFTRGEIVDYSGRVHKEFANQNRIDISGLASGLYFIILRNKNGFAVTKQSFVIIN